MRVWGLGSYWLSPGEILILRISGAPDLAGVWAGLASQAHPPAHFVLVHYFLEISRNFWFLKAGSLAPGVLLIAACFFLGRRAGGDVLGLIMSYMAAFGYGAVLWSEVIRPYSLLCLCITLAPWC